ncbi:MAG: nucleotidyltransferase domain-containing protein [Kiritimatiellae bacterium]|nr:nucleotidyltransferase domain-containing protein [Kiritimatiellia bacterium]HQG74902.1 nucleotidyltransferase domain-containing protein [Kiritimatiellia bacterium]
MARLPANAEIGLPDGLLREITGRIVREYAPERIVLFGSRARGDARPDSDIDLFVEMESSQNFYRRTAEVLGLFGVRPWALDLLVYTPREVERERGLLGLIVDEVESEGIALYEQKATKR